MEPKTGKRIVSRAEYVKMKLVRTWLWLYGASALGGFVGLIYWAMRTWHRSWHRDAMIIYGLTGFLVIVGGGALCFIGYTFIKVSRTIDPGVPLTRANTADLPAPDSLVRASSEPLQAQEAVLLRAAAEGQETPPEQLVRAVNGQE